MPIRGFKQRYPSFWLVNSLGWLVIWVIYMTIYYRDSASDPKAWLGLFITYLSAFLTTILLRYFYNYRKLHIASISQISVTLIISSILASQVWYWLDVLLSIPLHGAAMINRITFQGYLVSTLSRSITMLTWSTIFTGIQLWIEWNMQKERTEKANLLAHAAQLRMLRYQLNPHFLFNALNSIRALVEEDKKKAREMITELSEFLRYSLISRDYSDVPLSQELDAIRHYFAIEKKRYEEKLEVTFEIDPNAEDYPVLSFLIQPLVENAIKYGMKTSKMPLQIWIRAKLEKEHLNIEVQNTGKWVTASKDKTSEEGTGTGLDNIRQRLDNTYPNGYQLDLSEKDKTVLAVLKINRNFSS